MKTEKEKKTLRNFLRQNIVPLLLILSLTACAAVTVTQPLSLPVETPLVITSLTLPPSVEGVAYSDTLTATGGVLPYTWTISAGMLPTGLTLSNVGVLSGTIPPGTCALSSCTYEFSASVTDSEGAKAAMVVSTPKPRAPKTVKPK